MEYNKILITGGSGLVGNSLKKFLPDATFLSSKDYDLSTREGVDYMFYKNPDATTIIHLASLVGGINANLSKPADFLVKNILLNTFIIDAAYRFGIKRFITLSSSCSFPDKAEVYPMIEDVAFDGIPPKENFAYAQAKRTLMTQINASNAQYGTKYQYLIPCNLYGEGDKFGDNSHFISALIKKIHIAKNNEDSSIKLMGNGTSKRQFMHVDNLSYVIKHCLDNDIYDNMNVATEENLSIKDMAKIALKAMDAEHLKIEFDQDKSKNGQFRKDISIELLKNKIPSFKLISLCDGINQTYSKLLELGTLER